MKKIIFLFIFLLIMASNLIGCTNNKDDINLNDEDEMDSINTEIENINNSFLDYSLNDIENELNSI